MDILIGIYAEHDEKTILPLMLAVEDVVLAYYKRKYGETITIEEMMKYKSDVRDMTGEYILSEDEFNMYDTFTMTCKKREELKDDEIPFS